MVQIIWDHLGLFRTVRIVRVSSGPFRTFQDCLGPYGTHGHTDRTGLGCSEQSGATQDSLVLFGTFRDCSGLFRAVSNVLDCSKLFGVVQDYSGLLGSCPFRDHSGLFRTNCDR